MFCSSKSLLVGQNFPNQLPLPGQSFNRIIYTRICFRIQKKKKILRLTKVGSSMRNTQSRKKFRWLLLRWRCSPFVLWCLVAFFFLFLIVGASSSTLIHRNARRTRVSELKSVFDCWYWVCSIERADDFALICSIFLWISFSFDSNITGLLWAVVCVQNLHAMNNFEEKQNKTKKCYKQINYFPFSTTVLPIWFASIVWWSTCLRRRFRLRIWRFSVISPLHFVRCFNLFSLLSFA